MTTAPVPPHLPAPPPGSRTRVLRVLARWLRGLAWVLGVLVIAGVLATAGLWWWSGQDGSLATALRLAARSQPLQADGVEGALRGGGRVARLGWQQDGLSVQAEQVEITWQPLGLLLGQLQLDRLAAAAVTVDDRRPPSGEPLSIPTSIGLPLRVAVDDIAIGRIRYSGAATFEASALAGRYGFDGLYHGLTVRSLQVAQGRYSGEARLGAYASLPLHLKLQGHLDTQVPGGGTLPLSFDALVRGPLTALQVNGTLRTPAGAAVAPADAPQATLEAQLTPFAPQPVQQAAANFRHLDLAALWPGAPETELSGDAQVRPAADAPDAWQLSATLDNARAGSIDRNRLPLTRLQAEGEWRAGVALVRTLTARVAGGELTATGEWTDAATQQWAVRGQARNIDPGQVDSQLAAQPLDGEASLKGRGPAFDFDVALKTAARATSSTARDTAPRRVRGTSIDLRPLRLQDASAKGRWAQQVLTLDSLRVRTSDAQLDARLRVPMPVRGASGRIDFRAPGLRVLADGELRETAGAGQLDVNADNTALALAWLRQLPGQQALAAGAETSGRASLQARWQGGWRDPALNATLAVPSLDLTLAGNPVPWQVRSAEATLDGRLAQARLAVRGQAAQGARRLDLRLAGDGGQPGYSAARAIDWSAAPWQARVSELSAALQDPTLGAGTWRVATQGDVPLRWSPQAATRLEVGAGQARLTAPVPTPAAGTAGATTAVASAPASATPTSATIAWQPVRWRPGELITAGTIRGLPMAWIEPFAGQQMAGLGLAGTLVFDGSWDAVLGETLRLDASLARSAGDISVRAEDGGGGATRVAAGVREARVTLKNEGERVAVTLRWDSERAGTADGQLATQLSRNAEGGWQWAGDAPLQGRLAAQLPRIGVWSVLAPPGWRLRGSLATDLAIAGTRAAPSFTGQLTADDLALRSVVDGIEFGNGRLRARLAGTRMVIDEFLLEGSGDKGAGGTLSAKGEAGWIDGRAQASLQAQVRQLRASIRTDRQVTVSGELAARLDGAAAELKGALNVDRALIVLPEESKPELGSDVVIVRGGIGASGARAPAETSAPADPATTDSRSLALDVKLDLGQDFRIQGLGIDTRVRGNLDITGSTLAAPRVNGTVRTFGGQYRAYGQRLDVAQGVLIFNGAPGNPTLDVLALRANMLSDQKVGVQITGTALLPRVRLYASPDMPDAEKLSWLVLGRSSASGGAEAALLQQAALALLGSRGGGGMSGGLASALGLDELSVRGSSTNDSGTTTEGAITLGKRFSRNFYAAYERSLSGALGTLYVFYDLSRRWTVRAQTGEQSAVDLIYTLSYD